MKIKLPKSENSSNLPINYIILADASGSMWGSMEPLREAVVSVKDLMGPSDTLTVGYFSSYGDYDFFVRGLKITDSNLKTLVEKKLHPRGLTCYTQALDNLPKIVDDVKTITGNNNFAFYFLSDGYPNDRSSEAEIRKACKNLKGVFDATHIVGFGNYYNRQTLLDMAETLGGSMGHITNYKEIRENYRSFFKGKKTKKNVAVDAKYDIVWQVTDNEIVVLEQNSNNSVDVFEGANGAVVYGLNYSELNTIPAENLADAAFVYSLAFVLSQKNKANLGVSVLRKAGVPQSKALQKAFTVNQKGRIENDLKALALVGGDIVSGDVPSGIPLKSFLDDIQDSLGKISIDLKGSEYNVTTRKNEDVSKVEFSTIDDNAMIVGITGNENRPNISFLTVRKGRVTGVNDDELKTKIKEFNKTAPLAKIEFPIDSETFRNYTLVANGDFNYDKLVLAKADGSTFSLVPEVDLDVFDENDQTVSLKDFVSIYKQLIAEKAHVSVLNYYIKENSDTKHIDDIRVKKYGTDGAALLDEMGLDYQMRYAPKRGATPERAADADYIPFLEIDAALKGASAINAKKCFEKYETSLKKAVKTNPGDDITFPLFEKYEKLKNSLPKADFVELMQTTVKGNNKMVDLLKNKVSKIKFYLITTNSWFDGVEKSDEFESDGLVIKTKETKEYL